MTEADRGEWTATEIAAVIGFRYGEGSDTFRTAQLVSEFEGVGRGAINNMFNALAEIPGLGVNVNLNLCNEYRLSGEPTKSGESGKMDTRAGAFILGWLLARNLWFTLTEATDWTGWERKAARQVAEIRMRRLPIWSIARRRGPGSETMYVSIAG